MTGKGLCMVGDEALRMYQSLEREAVFRGVVDFLAFEYACRWDNEGNENKDGENLI